MKKINLLHLKTSANIGGAEVMLTYWPRYLDSNRFKQFVIFAEEGPLVKNMRELGTEVFSLTGLKGAKGFVEIPKLIKFLKDNNIDLIHAHGARVNLWGSIASFFTRIPIISTEHSIDLWRSNTHIFNLLDSFSARINRLRVGVSPAVCDMLIRKGIRREKVICIENGIDAERFNVQVDISAKRAELGIRHDAKVIGTVGRLVEQKGQKFLIEAASQISDKFSDVIFLIVGDGPLRGELEEQVINLGLKNTVIFAGQRADIPELLAIMDIFVLPSITEGLPLVLLEAMAANKPIIATKVSGIPYVIEDGVTGLLIEPSNTDRIAESIKYLLMNPLIAKRMADEANKIVKKKYNAKNMIRKYEEIYELLLR